MNKKTILLCLLSALLGATLASVPLFIFMGNFIRLSPSAENKILENNKTISEKTYSAIKDYSCSSMEKIQDNSSSIIAATQGILFSKEQSAADSYAEAMKIEKSNPESAKLYLLNAINHVPNNITYINEYCNLLENRDSSYDELSNAISVLNVCLYQVDHKDIQQLNKKIAEMEERQQLLISENTKADEVKQNESILSCYNSAKTPIIVQSGLTATDTQTATLSKQLSTMDDFISQVKDIAQYDRQKDEIQDAYEKLSETADFISLCKQIEAILPKLSTAISTGHIQLAESYSSMTETLMTQLLGINQTTLALSEQHWIDTYIEKKDTSAELLNKAKSTEILKKITTTSTSALSYSSTKHMEKINKLQDAITSISELSRSLYDLDFYNNAQSEIQKLQEKIISEQKEQSKAYQQWAANTVLQVKANFEDNKNKKDPFTLLNESELCAISQSLIIPEISSVLQILEADMESKLKTIDEKRSFNAKFMNAEKKTLEDF